MTDAAASKQSTIAESAGDQPTVGIPVDERTHYAHARYAMHEQAGVIWYDPRDGHEKFRLEDVPTDEETGLEDEHLTHLTLHAKRQRCQLVDPDSEWVVKYQYKTREVIEKSPGIEDREHIVCYRGNDIYEDVSAAREAAAEMCEQYEEAEYRDAVKHRLGGVADAE